MKIVNKNFTRNYEEIETFEAGVALLGLEVKSIRAGHIKIDDAYAKIFEDGPYILNLDIGKYAYARDEKYDTKRKRKLLLNKDEILRLKTKLKSSPGLTLIPVSCYNKGPLFKFEIALCRGRKDLAKRKLEKARDIKLSQKKEAKEYMKS